jgi:Flp pilus assembly protein TadD
MSIALLGSWFVPRANSLGSPRMLSHSVPMSIAPLTAAASSPARSADRGEKSLEAPVTAPQLTAVQPSSDHAEPSAASARASHVTQPARRAPTQHADPAAVAAYPPPGKPVLAPVADELTRRANQELLRGRLASALYFFELATERDSRSEPAYRGLGVVNERMGRRSQAIQAFRRALELEPHGPQVVALRTRLQRLEEMRSNRSR